MAGLDLEQIEEVPVQTLPFPQPPVETMIKQAVINILKGRDQNGNEVAVIQFITPVMLYSIQLDAQACRGMSDELRPSGLVPATVADMPRG